MTKRDFKRAVSEVDTALAKVRMPPGAAARFYRRLEKPRSSFRRMGLALFALAAAGAGAWLIEPTRVPSGGIASPRDVLDGFETTSRSSDLQLSVDAQRAAVHVERGSCTLRVRDWGSVVLRAGAWLRQVDGGLELLAGAADFQVDKRAPGRGSTFVRVPLGSIEITGTRFSVTVADPGGSVRLDEGAIRFHSPDGRLVALSPGQSLSWPLPVAPAETVPGDPVAPAVPVAREKRSKPVAVATKAPPPVAEPGPSLVERIETFRAKGQYRALAEELRAELARERRPLTRERLSFELGAVLTHHLEDGVVACAHWVVHDRAFPDGRYVQEVVDARKHLNCNEGEQTK